MDSSDPSAAAENVAVVKDVPAGLQVSYRHVDLNSTDKCVEGLRSVTSPFVVFCADDDLLFPDAVWRCVEFLEGEPEYASAIGRNTGLDVTRPLWPCVVYQGYSIEAHRPIDRCRQMADYWFTNFYAVHRTETLHDIFQITATNMGSEQAPHLAEFLLSQLSVLRGRVKVLPLMYSLTEGHGTNASRVARTRVQPDAELHYRRFRQCLTEQLEQTGIDRIEAEQYIDDSYGHFRDPDVASRWRRKSIAEHAWRFAIKVSNLTLDYLGANHNGRSAIKRLLKSSDFVECGPVLRQAIQLVRNYPYGIPSDHAWLSRSA